MKSIKSTLLSIAHKTLPSHKAPSCFSNPFLSHPVTHAHMTEYFEAPLKCLPLPAISCHWIVGFLLLEPSGPECFHITFLKGSILEQCLSIFLSDFLLCFLKKCHLSLYNSHVSSIIQLTVLFVQRLFCI